MSGRESFALAALDSLAEHIAILEGTGFVIAVNRAWRDFAAANFGDPRRSCEGADYLAVCDGSTGPGAESARAFAEDIRALLTRDGPQATIEYQCHSPSERRWFRGTATGFEFEGERFVSVAHENITERKQAEAYGEMTREVLHILNEPDDFGKCMERILPVMKAGTGFDAVGIRLRRDDDFPYYTQDGFPEDFLLTENSLVATDRDADICRKEDGSPCFSCACGMVVSAKEGTRNPFLTPGGSFWTNDSTTLLDLPADKDPRAFPRNECVRRGYVSVALIPIKTCSETVGLIQFNDRRSGCFFPAVIQVMEGIAGQIGTALMRKRSEQALAESHAENRRLFHELQHRAKNSFNMISGMISYASSADIAAETKAVLDVLSDRVSAVARLYTLLYETGATETVGLELYCPGIAHSLIDLHRGVTLATDMEPLRVKAKIAGAIGLIVTELVTNALKYAFPGGGHGTVSLILRKTGTGGTLEIRDDGVGIPAESESNPHSGTGLNLVHGLAVQIEGTFRMERPGRGTACIVDFKAEG